MNPGAVRSDIWRFIPKTIAPITDFVMRMLFIEVDEGCCTSVCTSVLPLESLSGEPMLLRATITLYSYEAPEYLRIRYMEALLCFD